MLNLYGLFVVLGILAGGWVVEKINKKYSILDPRYSIFDTLLWVLIPAIVGARLYHVINYWWYYAENPEQIFYIWQGGLGIWGGIIGGIVGLYLFVKYTTTELLRSTKDSAGIAYQNFAVASKNQTREETKTINVSPRRSHCGSSQNFIDSPCVLEKEHFCWSPRNPVVNIFLSYLDFGAVGLALGQAIGRWGNYFNQELYGLPTNLAWGIFIRPENRVPGYENFSYFYPLFLYESLGCLLIFIFLLTLITRKKVGTTFFLYLFLYSFLRFFLEFLRINPWRWEIFSVGQWLSLVFMMSALIFLLYKKRCGSIEYKQ